MRPSPPSFELTDETDKSECETFDISISLDSKAIPGPILLAAKNLHNEMKYWFFGDNDIIDAAKHVAFLMAKMSRIVDCDCGTRREFIECAKNIADASKAVSDIAKVIANDCKDRRMRLVRYILFQIFCV